MKIKANKIILSLTAGLLLASCQKDETNVSIEESFNVAKSSATSKSNSSLEQLSPTVRLEGIELFNDNPFTISQVVTPSECAPTLFNTVIDESVSSNIDALGAEWYELYAEMNFYYSLTDTSEQYFGANGEYTNLVSKITRGLEGFWNMSNEVSVRGQHNSTLNDSSKVIDILTFWYGLPEEEAAIYADYFINVVNAESTFLIESPLVSFDGFAIALEGQLDQGDIIVIGDGLIELAAEAGVDSKVVWSGIMAHEWGHQIQFNNRDWYPNGAADNAPEATRTTELEADFFTGYYLTHKRGGTYNWKKTEEFLSLFFNIGDCSFTSDGHHGTPAQRMEAAKQGYILAQNAKKKGHILDAEAVHVSFLEILETVVGPQENTNFLAVAQ
ncbi:hypothetical protein [Cellulophaga baltica]|uniref:hypothetical protein n=1 Tax=Cellulophaga baltica TaxID=76594 RepID=UPI0024946309|nr:hypothetical protein [Cellulophaga baltica]